MGARARGDGARRRKACIHTDLHPVGIYHGVLLLVENWLDIKPLHAHGTARWRLWLRYGLVQIALMGGIFAFIGTDLGIR